MKHITNFFDVSGRNRGILKGILFVLFFALASINGVKGQQLAIYEFTGTSTADNQLNAVTTQPSNATFSTFTRSGINWASGTSDMFVSTSSWGSAFSSSKYQSFTVTANSNFKTTISQISFSHLRTSAGATNWSIRSSADNYATDIQTGTSGTTSATATIPLSGNNFTDKTTALTFRIYAWGGGSTGNWKIDNVAINGNITSTSTPTKLAITTISPTIPVTNSTFNVTVQAQDGSNNVANVLNATSVSLSNSGGGTLGGNTTGTISAGNNSVTITGVTLSSPETGVTLTATATSGDALTAGTSSSFNILANQPTTTSSATAGIRSTTSIPISWTNGNGTARIVVARTNATTAVAPTGGAGYTVNSADFTDALNATTGTNNKVVYNGTGSSVTVTGLTAGTAYNFDVYEYNGTTGTYNYSAATSVGSTSTLATEPSTQTSGLTFTNVSATGMTIGWTSGNGTGRIVVLKASGTVDSDPVDGTSYSSSTTFGSGSQIGTGNYVVYANTSTNVTVTGLSSNTTYHVAIYEYNGSSTTFNYLTTASLTGNKTTSPNAATALTVGMRTATSTDISWTNGNGSSRIVVARLSSTTAVAPANGTTYTVNSNSFTDALNPTTGIGNGNIVVYNGNGSSTTITGLTSSTNYKYDIYEYNGSSYSIATSTAATSTLYTEPTIQSSTVTFSAIGSTSMTIAWINGNGSNRIVLVKEGSVVDSNPTDATSYTASLSFKNGTQIGTGNYVVYNGTGTSASITGLTANTTYYVSIYEFGGSGTNTNYLLTSPTISSQITLIAAPAAPTALTFGSVTSNSMNASFTAPASTPTGYLVMRRAGAVITGSPVGGTEYTVGQSIGAAANEIIYIGSSPWANYDQTSLTDNTTYYYAIYSFTSAGTQTNYSTALTGNQTTNLFDAPIASSPSAITSTSFTTNWANISGARGYKLDVSTNSGFGFTSPITLTEGFESGLTTNYLNGTATLETGTWTFEDGGYASTGTGAHSGTGCQLKATTGIAYTPTLSNITTLSFWAKSSGTSIKVNKTINGTTTTINTVTISNTWTKYNVTINDNSSNIIISFANNSSNATYIDDVIINYTQFSPSILSSYNNLDVSGTSQTVTGLSPNTAYYYRVRATGGNSTSANSNVVTAITGLTSSVSTSTLPDCPTCNIVINNGGTLTVNSNKTFGSVSADPGANITINNGNTLTAPVTLQSNSSSTATLVDNNTSSAITATVQQYLSGKTGTNSRGWWYVASPVSNATAAVFIPNGSSNKFGYWDEATGTYPQITDNSTSLNRGQGYVFYNPGNDAIVNFSGTLNTGDVTVYPTRTGTTNGSRGFNLVGNPYPSYLDWEGATKTHIRSTIWYRTMGGSAMTFDTYDNSTGTPIKTGVGVYGTVSNFIPPMQAFWVKVDADGLALNEASVLFRNADRSHQDQSSTNNHLRAPSENTQQPSIVRLRVSNGVNRDEAILVANSITSDDTDSYDVPKMPVNNTEVPELFSLAGQEELVINYQNNFAEGKEIQLGFRPGKATDFSIQAAEFSNADNNLNVILKDNGTEYDLTNGEAYNFSADATPTNTRFSIVFRAAGAVTSAATQSFNKINTYCNQAKQLIIQLPAELSTASASICNAVGQTIRTTTLQAGKNTLSNMNDGVYLIKVRVNGQAVTRKVVVK